MEIQTYKNLLSLGLNSNKFKIIPNSKMLKKKKKSQLKFVFFIFISLLLCSVVSGSSNLSINLTYNEPWFLFSREKVVVEIFNELDDLTNVDEIFIHQNGLSKFEEGIIKNISDGNYEKDFRILDLEPIKIQVIVEKNGDQFIKEAFIDVKEGNNFLLKMIPKLREDNKYWNWLRRYSSLTLAIILLLISYILLMFREKKNE